MVIVSASFRPFAFLKTSASAKRWTTHHLDFDCAVCLASFGKHIPRALAKIPQLDSLVVLLDKKKGGSYLLPSI